jgi:hypothetical protein
MNYKVNYNVFEEEDKKEERYQAKLQAKIEQKEAELARKEAKFAQQQRQDFLYYQNCHYGMLMNRLLCYRTRKTELRAWFDKMTKYFEDEGIITHKEAINHFEDMIEDVKEYNKERTGRASISHMQYGTICKILPFQILEMYHIRMFGNDNDWLFNRKDLMQQFSFHFTIKEHLRNIYL